MSLSILGSGSSGNASVLRTDSGSILIDAGLGPRTVAKRLLNTGVTMADIRAVVLTHLDTDHFNCNWVNTILTNRIRVYVHSSRLSGLLLMTRHCESFKPFQSLVEIFNNEFSPLPGVTFHAMHLPHDEYGSHGFFITDEKTRLGFATDLGRVPAVLIERFVGCDIIALESNYDRQMQLASNRPPFLQNRIMNGRGHLSNEQALAAIKAIFERCDDEAVPVPAHVVLLHRSRECNCPILLREYFSRDVRIGARLTLAEPGVPTPWLSPEVRQPLPGEQLLLLG